MATQPMQTEKPGTQPAAREKATRVGVVTSDVRNKSRTVVMEYQVRHPKYGKYLRRRTVLQVHDENNESARGDTVEVSETRPISKTKRWRLVRVVKKAPAGATA